MTQNTYKLKYKAGDDTGISTYSGEVPLKPGQAVQIPETNDWHLVLKVDCAEQGMRATLSVPADSPQEALHEAVRRKHWK